jgi:hypothetical protein
MTRDELIESLSEERIGKETQPELGYATLDINSGCTPSIRFICASDGFANDIANELEYKFLSLIHETMKGRVYDATGLKMSINSHERLVTHRYHDAEWRQRDLMAELQKSFREAPKYVPSEEVKPGWWRVEGLRSDLLVKANSEADALRKADEHNGGGCWESAVHMYGWGELPEVISL